jgi:hypothetical protein
MQLTEGRIPMNDPEAEAVTRLTQPGSTISRRDPGNTGPIVVALANGKTWLVDEEGGVSEVD